MTNTKSKMFETSSQPVELKTIAKHEFQLSLFCVFFWIPANNQQAEQLQTWIIDATDAHG